MNTGYIDLDKSVGGFNKGELIILGGRPGMGTTSLAIDIVRRCGNPVLFISLDPQSHWWNLSCRIEHDCRVIEYYDSIVETTVYAEGIMVNRTTKSQHFGDTRKIRELIAPHKNAIDLIIIDYIQLLKSKRRVKELKELAQEINKPILALAHLCRACEARKTHHPRIGDLWNINDDQKTYADKVLLLYRDDYYNSETPANIAEITIYKKPGYEREKVILEFNHTSRGMEFFDHP